MYDRYKGTLSNYAVDLDFYWFCPHSLQALRKVSVKHLLAAVRVKRGQILPMKTTLFLFFAGLKCTVTIETPLPQYGICKENSPQFWCNSFFSLNVPERMRQGFDWSVTYSLKCILRIYGLSYWKTNSLWVKSTLMGARQLQDSGNTRGGGFVFLKHYHCQCTCWLYYVASFPSQPCGVNMFVRPFDFVLIFVSHYFIFLTASGTWHFIIVYMYIQQVVIWHWPLLMLSCSYQSHFFFPRRLDVIFLREWNSWVNKTNCMNVRWERKKKKHWFTHLS